MTIETTPVASETAPIATPPYTLDLRGMLDKLRIPGVDIKKLIDNGRKDIEALLAANEQAFITFEVLTRKQTELLSNLIREWQAGARGMVSKAAGVDKPIHTAEHIQLAFTQALTRMKEMAEIAAKSNAEILGMLNKRYHESLAEVRGSISRKPQ